MNYSENLSALTKTLAYLDPGSGSILIQLLITVLLSAGAFIYSQWAKIKRLLGISPPKTDDSDTSEDDFLDE